MFQKAAMRRWIDVGNRKAGGKSRAAVGMGLLILLACLSHASRLVQYLRDSDSH